MSTNANVIIIDQDDTSSTKPAYKLLEAYNVVHCGLGSDFESLILKEKVVPNIIFIKNQPVRRELLDALDAIREVLLPNEIPTVLITESEGDIIDTKILDLVSTTAYQNEPWECFQWRLVTIKNGLNRIKESKERADSARAMAFSVMAQNSKMGEIIQTLESTFRCVDYESLGKAILEALARDGLDATLRIFVENGSPLITRNHENHEQDSQLIECLRSKSRIVDSDHQTIFNYDHVSLLIRNMPVDDSERYGQIKDEVCILMNATESRVKSLEVESRSLNQSKKIEITCKILNKMLDEMLKANDGVAEDLNEIIEKLQQSIHVDIISFNMHESEEAVILSHLDKGFKNTADLLNKKLEREKSHSQIMYKLLDALAVEQSDLRR